MGMEIWQGCLLYKHMPRRMQAKEQKSQAVARRREKEKMERLLTRLNLRYITPNLWEF